jgi:hypothetical protein
MGEKGKRKVRSPQEGDDEVRKNFRLDKMETSFDFCQRMTKMKDAYRKKVGMTLALMDMENNLSNNDIKTWVMAQVNGMDEMASMVTEVVEEMDTMREEDRRYKTRTRRLGSCASSWMSW